MPSDETRVQHMEFNEDLLTRAKQLANRAEEGTVSLPQEIDGFPGFFVASADDASITTVTAIVSAAKVSYKIGNPAASSSQARS